MNAIDDMRAAASILLDRAYTAMRAAGESRALADLLIAEARTWEVFGDSLGAENTPAARLARAILKGQP